MWKCILCIFVATLSVSELFAQDQGPLIMFWNLENFFDWQDGGANSSDAEFSSDGARHWTKGRFYTKCNAIAKSVLWIKDEYGRIPDIIGVAEVENRFVLSQLVHHTALEKEDYGIVHYDSPDPRGIDVALLYRKGTFAIESSRPHRVNTGGKPTRDILEVTGTFLPAGLRYAFLVNHHPSKYGGSDTAGKRSKALETMMTIADSLVAVGLPVVSMGDFNENPTDSIFLCLDGHLESKALPLAREGQGSIRFNGKWDLIDLFFTSEGLPCSEEIVRIPFLTVRDNVHSGEKPLRTYSGPRWLGGVSDHCPVILKIGKL